MIGFRRSCNDITRAYTSNPIKPTDFKALTVVPIIKKIITANEDNVH